MNGWLEDGEPDLAQQRWPMAPAHLLPLEQWRWWEQLWAEVVTLRRRYRLVPAKDWWEDAAKVEALAALAARVARYDSGGWDDPPGKLSLLYDLKPSRVALERPRSRRALDPHAHQADRGRVTLSGSR